MCFAEKDTPAHHAKFRKSWNSKYMSVNWWRGVVIIPMSAPHWLWTCPSSFILQWCWPEGEGSFYRRQVLGRKGRDPSGQWLRMSLHLLSPPSLHKSSSPGAVPDWCIKHPKTFPGHTTMAFWRYMSGAGAPGWHQGHGEGHLPKAKAQLFHVLMLLLWTPRTDRAVQCSVCWGQPSGMVRSHTFPPHSCEQVRLPPPLGRQWPVLQGCSVITLWTFTHCLLLQVCSPWIWCPDIWDEQWVGQQWLCSGCPGGASWLQVPALVPSSPSCSRCLGCWPCRALAGKTFWRAGVVFLLVSW